MLRRSAAVVISVTSCDEFCKQNRNRDSLSRTSLCRVRVSAEIARCSAAPWAPELAEQRLSAGASGTGGERRQQVVELGLEERLAAPVLTPVCARCSPDGGL